MITSRALDKQSSVFVIRHLKDDDDLRFARDGPLLPGQESEGKAIAKRVLSDADECQARLLLFLSSTKRRALQTAALVADQMALDRPRFRIRHRSIHDIRELDQGKLVLPEEYRKDDHVDALSDAWRAFWTETFDGQDERKDNLLYRFGDPAKQQDGAYKYPHLAGKFSDFGENYRDVFLRVIKQILIYGVWRSSCPTWCKPVVFAHAQTSHMFRDLSEIARGVAGRERSFQVGTLAHSCWRVYLRRKAKEPGVATYNQVDDLPLMDPEFRSLLTAEIEHLASL